MTDATSSAAVVSTDRPARYGKQLASHLGRRSGSTWDEEAGTGRILFDGGAAWVDVACSSGELRFDLTAGPDLVERLEGVIGGHLVRFGATDEFVVAWTRSDGSAGTRQDAASQAEHQRRPEQADN